MLQLNTGKLQQAFTISNHALNDSLSLRYHPLLSTQTSADNAYYINRLIEKQQAYDSLLRRLTSFLKQSSEVYEQAENSIKGAMQSTSPPETKEPFWDTRVSTMKFQHRFHHSISADKGIMGYINNGVCAGLFLGFHIGDVRISKSMKYLTMQGNLSVGQASISGDVKAVLKQNDAWNPALIFEAEASAAIAKATANIRLGNSYLHADGELSGAVGVASAEARAIINKDEISLKAEAGVAALKGEVKGSLSLFGATISITGSGEVGSIGGGAEFSSKKGEWELGGKLSFIAGLGFKIKVKYD